MYGRSLPDLLAGKTFVLGAVLILRVRSQRVTMAVLPAGGPQAFKSTG
jgi:hypothetical protein